jgi:drug/metabolite transporter (DMT)-like permease
VIGPFFAIVAAILFGLSSPLAKSLIGEIDPWLLAGLLYLGSGIGMALIQLIRIFGSKNPTQIKILRNEVPWLLGVIFFGGISGPVLLMYGLARTPASSASLLLNLEGVFTAGLAWVVFKEHYDRRIVLGMVAIIFGGAVLSWSPGLSLESFIGPLLVAGACLSWGIDNNLTRKISLNDPILVTLIKSLAAGFTNLVIALALGARFPNVSLLIQASALGFVCYGLSIVCFILALRWLGASRTGAYFSAAPFVGAFVAIGILHEPVTSRLLIAAAFMAFGIYLHLTESHDHEHTHLAMEHEHSHSHDDHHQHEHEEEVAVGVVHSHKHRHAVMTHRHPHFPDMHHTHDH